MQLEDIGSRLPEGITPDGIKPNATEGQKQPTLATSVQAKGTLTRTQHRPSPEKRGRGAFRPKSGRTKRGVLFTVESPEGGKEKFLEFQMRRSHLPPILTQTCMKIHSKKIIHNPTRTNILISEIPEQTKN
jgi:hypothetical protein